MKTFKNIEFKPCEKGEVIRGRITINGHVVSVISGLFTQGTPTSSPLVHKHTLFEVAVWPVDNPHNWNTKKWIRDAKGTQCAVKGGMNRRQINTLLKKIQSA